MTRVVTLVALLALVGCGDESAPTASRSGDLAQAIQNAPPVEGEAVVTVDGRAVPFALVQREVRKGRAKKEVVRDAVHGELFHARAVSMGYLDDDAVIEEHKRLMVARLLQREVEEKHSPESVDAARVKAYYDDNLHLYFTPALRAADHILVKPTSKKWDPSKNWDSVPESLFEEARAWAKKIHADIAAMDPKPKSAADLQVVADRWKGKVPSDLEVIVESLPATPRRPFGEPGEEGYMNAMVPEFADGMFSLTGVGSVSGPVDTLFGTHILVVTRHREADRVTRADAEAGIREHLATKDRRIAMTALLTQLLSEASVRADASLLDKFGATAAQ